MAKNNKNARNRSKRAHNLYKITYIKYTLLTLFVCLFFLPGIVFYEETGENFFHIKVNGEPVGCLGDRQEAQDMLLELRKNIASEKDGLTFMQVDLEIIGEEVLFGQTDPKSEVRDNMEKVLRKAVKDTLHPACTLKVNEYVVNLANMEEAQSLLQAAIDKYDSNHEFEVSLVNDTEREFNIITACVDKRQKDEENENRETVSLSGGVDATLAEEYKEELSIDEMAFDDFEVGMIDMRFDTRVEIVEAYLPASQLVPLEEAIEHVVRDQATAKEYEVVAGDTLSEIALKVNIPMEDIVDMNSDILESVNTPLHIGDKLIVTVPEAELSVARTEQNFYEETYDAEIIYIDNNDWYTTETKVHQQPSAGFRKVIADEHYLNDKLVEREIIREEVVMEAVPKIVERGTKIPPTYIKPISGGRQSSGFGKRKAPTKGASTFHKGIDWAVPQGTPVYASCGGTVVRAGWGNGYGYCVYINHEDGRQTRYGHCSKVLVSVGQTVKQGEKIALSGNTGVSSGPHLHFEILINGSQVNPLNYLN